MVAPVPRLRSRRGAGRLGCLITLVLVGAVLYYGADLVAVYFRYWQLKDEMRTAARLAPSLDDATIQRRIRTKVDALALPTPAQRITIRRLARPREIRISTSWEETVVILPFCQHPKYCQPTLAFKPEVRAPL